jgi:hypothetical protein
MTWMTVLAIVVNYCGPGSFKNECREERMHCVKNAVALNPKGSAAEDVVDACLSNPEIFKAPKAASSSGGK